MKYKIDDRLYHPVNGAVIVEDISEVTVMGEVIKAVRLKLVEKAGSVSIPMNRLADSGLRRAVSATAIKAALDIITQRPVKGFRKTIWTKRVNEFTDMINSGDINQVALATRDVYLSARGGDLSHTGRVLYERGRNRLAQEAADVLGGDPETYRAQIDAKILKNPYYQNPVTDPTT